MRQVALLLAMVLGIPLVAFGVARGMQAFAEADWREALENTQRPKVASQVDQLLNEGEPSAADRQPLTPAQLDRLKLCVLCANPVSAAKLSLCTAYNRLGAIEKLAVAAFALGLALLACIAIAGRVASLNRSLLIAIFKPGLYLTVAALCILILLDGLIAAGALYYGPGGLSGSIRLKLIVLIGAIGILAASGVGAILIVQTTWKALKPPKASFIGKSLTPEVCPQLWEWISEIAARIGITPPQHVVATLDMNFCVTDVGVRCLDGDLEGRTLILSLPFSRILTPEELLAIVAHEMGHVHGRDTAYTKRFAPIYHGAHTSLATLARTMNEEGWHGIALIPSYAILTYFLHSFASAERPIRRERELAADQAAAQSVGAANLATALVKLHAFGGYWRVVLQEIRRPAGMGGPPKNLGAMFAEEVQRHTTPDVLEGLDDQEIPHPIDTHPPLSVRLQALGLSLQDVAESALVTAPEPSAIQITEGYEALERLLSERAHVLLAK